MIKQITNLDDRLLDKLTMIAQNGFGSPITREDVENHTANVELLLVAYKQEEPVAFGAFEYVDDITYIHGVVTHADFQKQGLFTQLATKAFVTPNIALRTQNPVMYTAAKKITPNIFPNEFGTNTRADAIAKRIAHFLHMDIDEQYVSRHTYEGCLYTAVPQSPDSNLFQRLDPIKGDSMLVVGYK